MPKKKLRTEIYSYGIYSKWVKGSRELPRLKKITTAIDIEAGVEFGYVLKIKGAKGKRLNYQINHPPFTAIDGQIEPPFTGQIIIPSNDYSFFLGDTVWEPYADKQGEWELVTDIEGVEIARKKFILNLP